jgi:hypothetical protein
MGSAEKLLRKDKRIRLLQALYRMELPGFINSKNIVASTDLKSGYPVNYYYIRSKEKYLERLVPFRTHRIILLAMGELSFLLQ